MNVRAQLICAHSTPLYIVLLLIGLFILPGWLPPPSPDQTAEQFARIFHENHSMRIGAAIIAVAASLGMALPAAISAQMRRMEGANHVFADVQMLAAAVGVLGIFIPAMLWLAISYRPDVPPAIVMPFNDMAWFIIIGGIGSAIVENVAIGLCILLADGPQLYPRWLGYWNLWLATGLLPGALLPFFKSGPFAWNGLFGFWTVVTAFFIWLVLNYIYTVKAIRAQS